MSEKTRGEAGVERAEALVLDDARRDRERAAGGTELKADLWFVRTSTCLGSTERTFYTARLENRGSEEGERGDRARVARAIGALRGPRRDSARVVRNGRGRVSYRRRRHRGKAPRGVAAGVARRRSSRRRAQSARPSRRRGGVDVTARTLTISRGWMMQVAPMPDKPPFMNGLTAFQVALSLRDMVWVVWCVRRRTERRSRGGCFFCHRAREYRPNRRPSEGNLGCAPRDCQLLAELAAVFTAGRGEIRGFKPSGRHPSRFASRRDARVWRRTTASDFSGRKKITGRRSCDDRSIRRRVASDSRVVRFPGGTDARSGTRRARSGAHGAVGRSRHREEGRTRATLDSVESHP